MHPIARRLAAVSAVGALSVVAPVAGASALPPPDLPAFTPSPLAFVGPSIGQVAAVIGPTVLTSAPSTFNNTNIQVTAGSALGGGQFGP